MIQRLALRTLADLLEWTDDVAAREFAWLRLFSRLKYDSYHDYLAGVRFIESLVTWLRQFQLEDRAVAYDLVRKRLVFVSAAEMRRLVERFYPGEIQPRLVEAAATTLGIPWYRVWANPDADRVFRQLRRQTLFMGLSDGARMDIFRRANVGIISNEQTVLAPLLDHEKWNDLGRELRKDELMNGVTDPKFTHLYLIDDLIASGTTLIRFVDNQWKGKLPKLHRALQNAREQVAEFPLAKDLEVHVYHYIATRAALDTVRALDAKARAEIPGWFSSIRFEAGHELDDRARLVAPDDDAYRSLAVKYYDTALEDRHSRESGVEQVQLGYKGCALILVLEHNTPNNSIPLLWADTSGAGGAHAIRPLFRRRSRHV